MGFVVMFEAIVRQLTDSKRLKLMVALLLCLHAGLLAWGAYYQSPTVDEVAHLPAGISHWQFGRFDLYRVNPPLVRMVAALPVIFARPKTDWHHFSYNPRARLEFTIGYDFVTANGKRSFWLFTLARWACIPFSLLGGYICFLWARELYGPLAGLLAVTLWCFCPNVLAHGQLITPDLGAAAIGLAAFYLFWHWLKLPGWPIALLVGLVLGLSQLAKSTWVVLFALWPLIWLSWKLCDRTDRTGRSAKAWFNQGGQLVAILFVGLGVLNAGYGFEGAFQKLGGFHFVSQMFAGTPEGGPKMSQISGRNRFTNSWLEGIPVPLPSNYLRGIDLQRSDFESGRRLSYLRGELRHGGWWYYYLYALAVKAPLGTCVLFVLGIVVTFISKEYLLCFKNEILLLTPIITILTLVSSQTGFSAHLRYILLIFPLAFVWLSRVASQALLRLYPKLVIAALVALFASVVSSLWVYPHSISYFNELAGGPAAGPSHLLDSNIDWGQDLLYLERWLEEHPQARPLGLAYYGMFDPQIVDSGFTVPPHAPFSPKGDLDQTGPKPGWYAVSVNLLYSYRLGGLQHIPDPRYVYFQRFKPKARAGYSIYIYHLSKEDVNPLRRELGFSELRLP
jgi:hypothetical protein